MQNVQKLTLILMETLYLNVKNRIRVYINAVVFLNILCKTKLILILDLHELFSCLSVVCIRRNSVNHRKIRNPAVAHLIRYPICQERVAVKQETTLGNTVGLVIELLRPQLIEVTKLLLL